MGKADRIFTIIVTATLTSAAWIVAGATVLRPPADPIALQPASASALGLAAPPALLPQARPAEPRAAATSAAIAPVVSAGGWAIPVANIRHEQLVDTFTQSRAGGERVHNAIDIAAPRGTPVIAAAGGVVEKLFQSDDGGKTIYVRLPQQGLITYYAHLDSYAPDLRQGMQVQRGQVLGTVGYTGNASPEAPHLHFAVWRAVPGGSVHDGSEPINPYPLLRGR